MNLFSSLIFVVLSNNILVSEVNSQEELARLNRTLLTRRNTRRIGTNNGDNQVPRLDNRQGLPRDLQYLQPTRRRCNKNIKIPNGKRRLLDGGTVVRFRCEPGFLLFGSPSAACVRGQWSEPIPACIRWGCGRLAIPYGTVGSPLYGGAAIYFECNPGFQMTSNTNLLVCDGQRWNGTVPVCRGAPPTTSTTSEATSTEFSSTSSVTSDPDLDEGLMDNWPDFTEDNKLVDDWITFAVETKRNMTSTPKPDWTVAIDLDKEDHDDDLRPETFSHSAIYFQTTNEQHLATQATSTTSTTTLPKTTTPTTQLILTTTTTPIPITTATTTMATTKIIPSTSSSSTATSTIWTTTRPARVNNRAPYGWNIPSINVTSNTSRGEAQLVNYPPTQRSSRRTTAGLNHLRCLLLSNAESTRRCLDALAHPTPRPVLRPWISGYPIKWYNMTLPTPQSRNVSGIVNRRVTLPISSTTLATSSSSTTVSIKITSTAPPPTTISATIPSTATARTTATSTMTTTTSTRVTTTPTRVTTTTITTPPTTTTTALAPTTTTTRRPRTYATKKIRRLTTTSTTSRTNRRIPATAPPPPFFPFPSTEKPSERDTEEPELDNSISQFLPREKNKLRGQSENERREFIAPFKLDTEVLGVEPKATSHGAFTTVAVVLVLLCLGTVAGFVAYRLWRRNMGIARPSRHASDRRNLSTSLDMEEEFVYFSNRSS